MNIAFELHIASEEIFESDLAFHQQEIVKRIRSGRSLDGAIVIADESRIEIADEMDAAVQRICFECLAALTCTARVLIAERAVLENWCDAKTGQRVDRSVEEVAAGRLAEVFDGAQVPAIVGVHGTTVIVDRIAAQSPSAYPGLPSFGAIVARGFESDPARRPTAAELVEHLEAIHR